jgi:hypothetical protein
MGLKDDGGGWIFNLNKWWSSSGGVFSLSSLEESMMLPKLRSIPDRNSSKQKHYENTIYRPRVFRGVIKVKIIH